MLSILIVEDEPLLAAALKHLVELNPLHSVTGIAEDLDGAMLAVEERLPDLALVDLQLANATSGYSVAARLHDLGVPCLFTTGKAPDFPLPDLAIGCLRKPFAEGDLVKALSAAEDMIRGRETLILRPKLPDQLQFYSAEEAALAAQDSSNWLPAHRSRSTLRSRISHWFAD
jgi:CheY-like chemotaxis protein